MDTHSLLELIEKLPAEKQKEVEDFVEALFVKNERPDKRDDKYVIKPGYGGAKGIIGYMSEDFDGPMDEFKDYI